jgi:hypothetical protein
MKSFLFSAILLGFWLADAKAQENNLPQILGDTLYTSSGFNIAKGQKIKIGTGSMPDGNFKYIRINSASFFAYNTMSNNIHNPNEANYANSLNRSESGHQLTVVKLEKRGDENRDYVYYVVCKGLPRYEIDIENAINAGEVIIPLSEKSASVHMPGDDILYISKADELAKFKKLLDQGVLTEEEYIVQKKKLLGGN